MKLTTYARPQMKHLGIQADGTVNLNYGIRDIVLASVGIDVTRYSLVGPIYAAGDYQPVVTGKAKVGESTEEAIRREVFEEVGYTNLTLIPFPRAPGFPSWTFAIAIRGTSAPPTTPVIDTRLDDPRRRIMVAVLHPTGDVISETPPPNMEEIVGLAVIPLSE